MVCTSLLKSKFFFQLSVLGANGWNGDSAFVQNFDITTPVDQVDYALSCVRLCWATEDETDYSIASKSMSEDNVEIEDWYIMVPLFFVVSVFHIVCSSYAAKSLVPQLPWAGELSDVIRISQMRS